MYVRIKYLQYYFKYCCILCCSRNTAGMKPILLCVLFFLRVYLSVDVQHTQQSMSL